MWGIVDYPDRRKLAGGEPDEWCYRTQIYRFTLRECLLLMLGARHVVRTTVVLKRGALDIDSNGCLIHPLDKRNSSELAQEDLRHMPRGSFIV